MSFKERIDFERKREERSKKGCLLALINIENARNINSNGFVSQVASALSLFTGEVDIKGWYRQASMIGILITEMDVDDLDNKRKVLQKRLSGILQNSVGDEIADNLEISFRFSLTSRIESDAKAIYSWPTRKWTNVIPIY